VATPTATTLAGSQAATHPGPATLAGGPVADRAASAHMPGNPATPTVISNAPAASAAPAAQAAPGNPQASSPATAHAVPATQAGGEARGNTVMASSDRAAARTDGPLPQGHTVEASQRRRGATARGLGTALLGALAGGRPRDLEIEIRRQADDVFRWLYWALTLTAWLCVALLVAAVLPAINATGTAVAPWAAAPLRFAGLAGLGLAAGVAAWLLARRGRN